MATFRCIFAYVGAPGGDNKNTNPGGGIEMPVFIGEGATRLTNLTTSGTSQIVQSGGSDFTAPADGVFVMKCDGDVMVDIGASPTASATATWDIDSGGWYALYAFEGQKIAVIDA